MWIANAWWLSCIVTEKIRIPRNIRVIPSMIHSIRMMCLLSVEIFPNPLTIDRVGNRWAIPQISNRTDAIYRNIRFIRSQLDFDVYPIDVSYQIREKNEKSLIQFRVETTDLFDGV